MNKEEFIFSYEWGKGDVVWDNLTVMHKASETKIVRNYASYYY